MVKAEEFVARRQTLMKAMGEGSVAIIPAADEYFRNGDTTYPFRQNSDFYYLTGFLEPEALLLLIPGRAEGEYLLFNRERNREQEVWTGPRIGQADASKYYGVDQAYSIHKVDEILPELLTDKQRVYYPIGDSRLDRRVMGWVNQVRDKIRAGINAPSEFVHIREILHEMRLRKSEAEIAHMRKAAEISAAAHRRVMQVCKPGMYEYQLEAELLHQFIKEGSRSPAYSSIVGAGKNACVLHYIDNNAVIKENDLVLVDAGAEYNYYAADITRTFPANGRFNEAQRAIYALVLKAQKSVIAQVKPGLSWDKLQETAVDMITNGLVELGLLKGKPKDLIAQSAYMRFYMHRIGHWIGMDVHDVGRYRIGQAWRLLEEGMVFTVEPGIYIAASDDIDKKWWNIGVRIEDDVVVTKKGCDILSKDVPKEINEIEALIQGD